MDHPMKRSNRILNGYVVIYRPESPSAMKSKVWDGYIYEHIYVIENDIGRQVRKDEVVHHMDCDRSNNRLSNLLLLPESQHVKLHAWMDKGCKISKTGDNPIKECSCGARIYSGEGKHCSLKCAGEACRKVKRPSKEQLEKDVAENSFLELSRRYGISDNAIRKWCNAYGINHSKGNRFFKGEKPSKEELLKLLGDKNQKEIGKDFEVSQDTIGEWIKLRGVSKEELESLENERFIKKIPYSKDEIEDQLKETGGLRKAAEAFNISRNMLYTWMDKLKIEWRNLIQAE